MKQIIKLILFRIIEIFFKIEKKVAIKGLAYSLIKWEIERNYKFFMHKRINLDNPKDLNEKINWLKLHSDYQLWSDLADKYKVRDYIKSKGLNDILIPLYGVWNNANEIDFSKLPESFVLKTNHGSGDVEIVRDKESVNFGHIVNKLNKFLQMPYGISSGEPHYLFIKPKIVAEALLIPAENYSSSLVDYKIWCFNGKPHHIWACYNRTKSEVKVETRDLEWNHHPEYSVFNHHYVDGGGRIPKPKNLERMLEIARILSEGFKEVRVDLYNQEGKIYFGEMTFTGNGGYMDFYTNEFLLEMGELIDLKENN